MTLQEFQDICYCIKNRDANLGICECDQQLVDFCRSVFDECKETMPDDELEQMLKEYLYCLPFDEAVAEEAKEIIQLREEVCCRLVESDFGKYGAKWADALSSCIDEENSSSLALHEKCTEIYEKLKNEYGMDVDNLLADSYHHTALFCDLHEMHENVIKYNDKALELYWKANQQGEDNLFEIGMGYRLNGEAYMALRQSIKAKACFEKAIEIITQDNPTDSIHLSQINLCKKYIREIQTH